MNIRILFFGATANEAGRRSIDICLDEKSTAELALDHVLDQFPQLKNHRLLYAVNQEYVRRDYTLHEGDDLAIFTPVSGG
jgi:molybdopterin converting factor small subunit